MKTSTLILLFSIIVIVGAVSILYAYQLPHYSLEIQGMKDTYIIGEEYSFYYTLSGYGNTCGTWLVWFPDQNGDIIHKGEVVDCHRPTNVNLSYDSRKDSRMFNSFVPNIEGTYNVTVSIEKVKEYAIHEFRVMNTEPERTPPPEPPFEKEEPFTKIEIMFGEKFDDKLVPVTFTEVTTHAETLDEITVWNFELIGHSGDDRGIVWDTLPDEINRIWYEITDDNGKKIIDNTRMPENWVIPSDQHIYEIDCGLFQTVKGESAHPTSILIKNNTSIIHAKNSWMGIYPDSNGEYSFEFASIFEHYVRLPEDIGVIVSHETKECDAMWQIDGKPRMESGNGYYTKMSFRLEN